MASDLTLSAQQTIKFFEEFVRRKTVADFIKSYREYLKIPTEGLEFTELDERELNEPLGHLCMPKRARLQFPDPERGKPFRVVNTCMAITGQEGSRSFNVAFMLLHYLFFNKITDRPLKTLEAHDDLLMLEHLPTTLSEYDNEDHFLLKCMYEHFESTSKSHPIALYINPEASQRQIEEFISKNWSFIEAHQKDVKSNFAGLRKRSNLKRDDFIYENRKLPRKEIVTLVAEKFNEFLDVGHIGKIISLEKKRRENK